MSSSAYFGASSLTSFGLTSQDVREGYRFKKLVGSPLTQIALVFIGAWRKRHLDLPSDPSLLFSLYDVQINDDARKLKQKLPHSKQFWPRTQHSFFEDLVTINLMRNEIFLQKGLS
nr:protein NRT1/ PTR FAMILY 6.3-like [Tanacetum cinerariifolium]